MKSYDRYPRQLRDASCGNAKKNEPSVIVPEATVRQFKIGVWEEIGGYVTIQASSEETAMEKAQQILDDHGITGLPDLDVTHRQCFIVDGEEEFK